jgi:hypothetical protein
LICTQLHLVNPKTDNVLGGEEDGLTACIAIEPALR